MRRREFSTLLVGGAAVFVPQERRWSQATSINLTRFEKAAEVAAKRSRRRLWEQTMIATEKAAVKMIVALVCTENLIRIDCVTESPKRQGDDRAALLLPDPVRLAVQSKSRVLIGNSSSEILVVQSAQNWRRQRPTVSLDGTRDRCILVQR